ncbi:hypothetical protein [Bacillus thuringiensis]|uniref:hypothetical protein n=1 Tax=Bacillus thuringiensis TaxID=1428 RepID=UPI001CC9A155|nr:hypothetical protein [Bacillus thuringiensis]MBZ8122308.1 hypothetical protein [Bacillus thuringiensis]
MSIEKKSNKEELRRLLKELLVRAQKDVRVREFVDDFKEFLSKENQSSEDFKDGLNRLQQKHFPNFEEGESKND